MGRLWHHDTRLREDGSSPRRGCGLDEFSISELITWIVGVLGLGAIATAYFSATARQFLPTPRKMARLIKRRDLSPAPSTYFTVLVSDLKHDTDGRQTDHVAAALAPFRGIDVVRTGPGPEWDFGSRTQLELQARQLLEQKNGDVLIFGETAKADERLRLHVLGRPSGAENRYGTYELDKAELPTDFNDNFALVLVACVVAHSAPAAQSGTYLADLLLPTAGKLKRLCDDLPRGLDPDQKATVWHAFGLVSAVLGDQTGRNEWLRSSIDAYHAVLALCTRDRVPLDWAMTQNNLGTALSTLGERESGTARSEEAVAAFRHALEERTRDRVPLDWAATQNNLGNALRTLGERESGTARLEEAVAAFRHALEEYTRDRVPLDWAMTQNNLGAALTRLGERESGTVRLEEAVAAYRHALDVFEAAEATHYVAATQQNLDQAEVMLGERSKG